MKYSEWTISRSKTLCSEDVEKKIMNEKKIEGSEMESGKLSLKNAMPKLGSDKCGHVWKPVDTAASKHDECERAKILWN